MDKKTDPKESEAKSRQGSNKYDDRTKQLMELRGESERQFDKQIIYLSGGALVFSIGFVKDIIGDKAEPDCKWMLVLSWICFAIALIVNLFSYLSSKKAIDGEIIGKTQSSKTFNLVTIILNWISIIELLIGLTFIILFAIKNF